jgi:translation initiation factor 3 subunit A
VEDEKIRSAKLEQLRKTQLQNKEKELDLLIKDNDNDRKIDEMIKAKMESDRRLKKEEEKVDHFVRACHEVEIPLLSATAAKDAEERGEYWTNQGIEHMENLRKERTIQAENRERLLRMLSDKSDFFQKIVDAREEEFKNSLKSFQAKLQVERERKLAERKEDRKQKRKQAYYEEIANRKKMDEEIKRAHEEKERNKKLDEIAEKQRAKDREIEEKIKSTTATAPAESKREKPPLRREEKNDDDVWRRPQQSDDRQKENVPQPAKTSEPYRPRHLREQAEAKPPAREFNRDFNRDRDTKDGPKDDVWRVDRNAGDRSAGDRPTYKPRDDRDRRDDRGPSSRGGPGGGGGGGIRSNRPAYDSKADT